MSTTDIYIPQSMIDLLQLQRHRKDFIQSLVLMYSIMEGWSIKTKPDSFGRRWKPIHDSHFVGVTTKRNTRAKIRKWLVENGFIEIRQTVCKDGKLRPLRVKKKTSQQYRIKSKKKWTTYTVDADRYHRANAITITGDDWASNATRVNLSLLTRTDQLVKGKNNRTNRAIWVLENNTGIVRLGRNVRRLYSPFCFASEEVRGLFLFDGETWASFDLGSAQPTIVGKLADDQDLMVACKEDELYPAIAELLGFDPIAHRKKAKGAFYVWCYGPTQYEEPTLEKQSKKWTKLPPEERLKKQAEAFETKKRTWEVQKYMAKTYPKTDAYAAKSKLPNYRTFSRKMQDFESDIFIRGIFAELVNLGIPALTCHDGIYFPISHADQVEQICEKYLSSFFGSLFILNPSNNLSLIDSVCIS